MTALAEVPEQDPLAALRGVDPPRQLSEHLLPPLKRMRIPFDEAWKLAWDAVQWPDSRRDAREWQLMLDATQEGWRAAYEDEPATRGEHVVGELAA